MITANQNSISTFSRVFTSGVMRELAKNGYSKVLSRLMGSLPKLPEGCLVDFFEHAYARLCHEHGRNEYIYKNVLTHKLLLGTHSLQAAAVIPELRVGTAKADFTVFNGTSSVYEIKTDRDTLKRLQNQIAQYRLFFDHIHVIAGESHIEELIHDLPSMVGVVKISKRMQRTTIREATPNWMNTDPAIIFDTLRRDEINALLSKNGFVVPCVPNTQMRKAQFEQFKQLDLEQIHHNLPSVMRQFRGKQSLEEYIQALPPSLKAMGISLDFSARERKCFLDTLNIRIDDALNWA